MDPILLPANPSSPPATAPDAPAHSVINRKRQVSGLSSSFSSNLGGRAATSISISTSFRKTSSGSTASASASAGAVKSHTRSVKSIVAWLEHNSDREASQRSSSSSSSSNHENSSNHNCNGSSNGDRLEADLSMGSVSSKGQASVASTPTTARSHRVSPDNVEEDDDIGLTLLQYREYLAERPLARCLDDVQPLQGDAASELAWPRARKREGERGLELELVYRDAGEVRAF
ncbi:hypothetical protein ESCO_006139 [Escovopsis weberi]|uniref:Uncharacterized protein n=1 Tax=Escovopsis weberi TaxID=150374 RepID=A0A0M8N5E3_ESCWE|nr:hypothetical protein ESCO_006139 [Escovopsis weberi]